MAVSHLRRWWGSRLLLPFAAGLTLAAMTVGAGSGSSTAVTPGTSSGATLTAASAPVRYAVSGTPAPGVNVAVRSAKAAGCAAGVVTNHDSRGDVAPSCVLGDQPVPGGAARRNAARDDVLRPLDVAYAPRVPRAPPLHLA
jgi:hypothetical protein